MGSSKHGSVPSKPTLFLCGLSILLTGDFSSRSSINIRIVIPKQQISKNFVDRFNSKFNSEFPYIRVYYYDCPPIDKSINRPIQGTPFDLSTTHDFSCGVKLLKDLKRTDLFAVREGFLSVNGWKLRPAAFKKIKQVHSLTDRDFKPVCPRKEWISKSDWILRGFPCPGKRIGLC